MVLQLSVFCSWQSETDHPTALGQQYLACELGFSLDAYLSMTHGAAALTVDGVSSSSCLERRLVRFLFGSFFFLAFSVAIMTLPPLISRRADLQHMSPYADLIYSAPYSAQD